MRKIQNSAQSDSNSGFDGEAGVVGVSDGWDAEFDEDTKYKRLKDKNNKIVQFANQIANQKINLISYIKNNIKINFEVTPSPSGWDHKACCPFKDHRDNSPSFFANSQSNTFKCFGCGKGGGVVSFIAYYFDKDIITVAEDIISKYSDLEDSYNNIQDQSQEEVDNLILELNNYVRRFIIENKTKSNFDKYFEFVERLMWSIDVYLEKHYADRSVIDIDKLTERVRIVKSKLNKYE